jgi:hypothetical protein
LHGRVAELKTLGVATGSAHYDAPLFGGFSKATRIVSLGDLWRGPISFLPFAAASSIPRSHFETA